MIFFAISPRVKSASISDRPRCGGPSGCDCSADLRPCHAQNCLILSVVEADSDGFVAKYMGDGVLAYFGYPQALEDDAERAVRAWLIEAVGKLRIQEPLQVRVGVATGLVVVGDLVGSGGGHERGVVGETPNLAARLQGIAAPNTVVIAEGTRDRLFAGFACSPPGATPHPRNIVPVASQCA
jgi:hypothetical protein